MFISILYMFRAAMCPSSGVLYQYDIWYMSLCIDDLWCAGLDETALQSHPNLHTKGHLYRVTYTRCRIDTVLLMMGTWLPETCRE